MQKKFNFFTVAVLAVALAGLAQWVLRDATVASRPDADAGPRPDRQATSSPATSVASLEGLEYLDGAAFASTSYWHGSIRQTAGVFEAVPAHDLLPPAQGTELRQ